MVRRGVVQLLSALLHNANLPGFITGLYHRAYLAGAAQKRMRAGIKLLFVPRRAGCLPHRLAAKHLCWYGVKVSVLRCGAFAFIRAVLRARHLRLAVPLRAGAGFVIQNPLAQAAQKCLYAKAEPAEICRCRYLSASLACILLVAGRRRRTGVLQIHLPRRHTGSRAAAVGT